MWVFYQIPTPKNLHHGPAEERHDKHHSPRGDHIEDPEEVAEGNRKTKGGELSVDGVEPRISINELKSILVALRPKVDDVLGGGSGEVHALPVDINRRRLRENVKDVNGSGSGRPRVAENGLVFTVEGGDMGRLVQDSKLGSALVEGSLDLGAVA